MYVARPPMGWNSWNTFGENIDESLIRETADAMVDTGLRDAGYTYLVIDDCWSQKERGPQGDLRADERKFPNGMKAVADYVHSKGLKFGMFSCDGVLTCAGFPGRYGHEFQDARTFAEWGVDFLKYDNCYKTKSMNGELLYRRMSMALKASGRDILFSACGGGASNPGTGCGARAICTVHGDIQDTESVRNIAESQVDKLCCSAPGCFNDLDMLVVGMYESEMGVGGCNDAEYRSFPMGVYLAYPMIGCDIRNMTPQTASLLNKVITSIRTRGSSTYVLTGPGTSKVEPMFFGTYPAVSAPWLIQSD
ncbi:MAG: glycoside hydrolase family 27 protein [Bianqueaceae bacterium]